MRFSEDFIERVRESTNITELIGQHVQLQKAGSSFRGLCPFPGHAEKTPSFFVSEAKQLYHCFGCKKSGTVYNFLMDFQGLTFPEAVEALANRAHIAIPEPEKKAIAQASGGQNRQEKPLLLKLNKYVGSLFQKSFQSKPENHPVRAYTTMRGLSSEIISEFKLGYAEPEWSELYQALKRGRAPLNEAEKLGLIKRKSNGEYFDIFRDRLIFPILSASGDVLGFGGRTLDDQQQPKYLNSPETPLFHKGKTLYGLHATAKYIRAQNETFVVEGYMDLLALYQYGIKNVVATLGTAFTLDHAKAIQKLCSKVIVLFDGDEAGQLAAEKSLPLLLEAGLFSRCLTLPDELDPDDFLREFGAEEFLKRAKEAPDHFLSLLGRKMQSFGGRPPEKVEVISSLGPILERVRDQRLRILYLQELADRLNVDPQWISQQTRGHMTQPPVNTNQKREMAGSQKIPIEESILVRFMLQKPTYLERVRTSGIVDLFVSQDARVVAQSIIEKYCQNPNDFDKLAASLIIRDQTGAGTTNLNLSPLLLTDHIAGRVPGIDDALDEAGELQLIQDCIRRVKERDLKIKSRSIINSLKDNQDSSSEKLESLLKIAQEQKGPRGGPT